MERTDAPASRPAPGSTPAGSRGPWGPRALRALARRPSGMTLLGAFAVAAIGLLLVVPLGIQVVASLRGPFLPFGVPEAQWGVGNYQQLFSMAGDFLGVLKQTALFVGGASLISIVLAWVLAWLAVRSDLPGRALLVGLVLVPFVIPPIVRAQAYVLMLAPKSGALNQLLRTLPFFHGGSGPIDPYGFATMTVVQGVANIAFPFLLLMPVLQNMNGSLEEASRTSGASLWRTLRHVTLPVLWPATLGVVALTVMLQFGQLEIPLLFGQQHGQDVFALKLWYLISPSGGDLPSYGLAAAYGVVFLAIMILIFRLYLRATRDADRRASVGGKAFKPSRIPLGRWRWPAATLTWLFLLIASVLPLIALAWSSVTPYSMPITWTNLREHATVGAFSTVLGDHEFWSSMGRTGVIAAASATIAVAVAMVAAFLVARGRRTVGTRVLDTLASSSIALPATIAGFSVFIFYLSVNRWVALSGGLLVLTLAYSYRIGVPYRTCYSAILQIGKELEEAAATSGASRLTTFRRVVLPLLMPTMFAVWVQLFVLGANEFTLAAFLATPQSRPFSLYLYATINPQSAQLYSQNQGAAMALLFTVLVTVVGLVLRAAAGRRGIGRSKSAPVSKENPA